jgi:heptosyltransferase-2
MKPLVFPGGAPRRILVRANNWIGDVVMISPSLRALREAYPDARIEIVAQPHVRDCFLGHPWVDEVIEHDPHGAHRGISGFRRLAAELGGRGYDLAVLFQKAFGAALMAWMAKAHCSVGYDTDRRGLLLTHPIHETAHDRRIHHVDYFLRVARAAGCDVNGAPRTVFFPLDEASRDFAERFLEGAGARRFTFLAAVATSASKAPRAWHAERFAALARFLARERGAGVLMVGGAADGADARVVLDAAGDAGIDAVGQTSVKQMAALIERCGVFIGNDSGPMHVAAALDVPVLAFFGPGTPAKTAPYMPPERFIALTNNFHCSPCRQNFFRECEPAQSLKPMCLETITVGQARIALDSLLTRAGLG